MKLYKTTEGALFCIDTVFYRVPEKNGEQNWDALLANDDLYQFLTKSAATLKPLTGFSLQESTLLAPIQSQEVWGAGVTYSRSKSARMEESPGGANFYDKIYDAERPELFFKATPHRVIGTGHAVRIRKDSAWNVPEPELTLVVTPNGKIIGYTVGNDMGSRTIEAENPLYLPQAKIYDQSCALGPCILLTEKPLSGDAKIHLKITRNNAVSFEGSVPFSQMKRDPKDLVAYLFRDNSFPAGCFLMTGTGLVPPNEFTLQVGDQIQITIDGIGTLNNSVK